VRLQVRLVKRPSVRDVRFVLGKASLKEGELPPGQKKPMTWDMEPGAKVSVLGVDQTEWAHKDFGNSPWGLLRLLAAGRRDVENSKDRTFRYTWTFDLGGEQRQADVELEVERAEASPLLDGTLLDGLAGPPERTQE